MVPCTTSTTFNSDRIMADPNHPFRTERLIMRAVESPDDDELFLKIQQSPVDFRNSNARLQKPQSKADAARYQKHVAETSLLGVVICLAPRADAVDAAEKEKAGPAIGVIHLQEISQHMRAHSFSEIGVDILPEYQGKGYGTEAINWTLQWGFEAAGLHRIAIRAFEYNYGARKLYERLGFTHEGTAREEIWSQGRHWDGYQYAMLDREWRSMQEAKREKA